jgi:hypothetical protein
LLVALGMTGTPGAKVYIDTMKDIDPFGWQESKDYLDPIGSLRWSASRHHFETWEEIEEAREIQARFQRISDIEVEAQNEENPLPTIGIEIEILNSTISQEELSYILGELHIPHYFESDNSLEVNAYFSYHALTQARIIQELTAMGAIRLSKKEEERHARIPQGDLVSMHINFGLPNELKENILYHEHDLYRLNDILTVAFTSSYRLAARKTHTSILQERCRTMVDKYSRQVAHILHDRRD